MGTCTDLTFLKIKEGEGMYKNLQRMQLVLNRDLLHGRPYPNTTRPPIKTLNTIQIMFIHVQIQENMIGMPLSTQC